MSYQKAVERRADERSEVYSAKAAKEAKREDNCEGTAAYIVRSFRFAYRNIEFLRDLLDDKLVRLGREIRVEHKGYTHGGSAKPHGKKRDTTRHSEIWQEGDGDHHRVKNEPVQEGCCKREKIAFFDLAQKNGKQEQKKRLKCIRRHAKREKRKIRRYFKVQKIRGRDDH